MVEQWPDLPPMPSSHTSPRSDGTPLIGTCLAQATAVFVPGDSNFLGYWWLLYKVQACPAHNKHDRLQSIPSIRTVLLTTILHYLQHRRHDRHRIRLGIHDGSLRPSLLWQSFWCSDNFWRPRACSRSLASASSATFGRLQQLCFAR